MPYHMIRNDVMQIIKPPADSFLKKLLSTGLSIITSRYEVTNHQAPPLKGLKRFFRK